MVAAGWAAPVDCGARCIKGGDDLAAAPFSTWPSPTVDVRDSWSRSDGETGCPRDDRTSEQSDAESLLRNVVLQSAGIIDVEPHVDEPGAFGWPLSGSQDSHRIPSSPACPTDDAHALGGKGLVW